MASVSKGKGRVYPNSWARHLRKEGKRFVNKLVRIDGKEQAARQEHECMEWWWYPDPDDVMHEEFENNWRAWEQEKENYNWWKENE